MAKKTVALEHKKTVGWKSIWPIALLAAVAFAIYGRTLFADFLRWDDRQNILLNPWLDQGILSLIWTRPYYNMYIPVTYTFWTALWHISHEPWIFHLANILLHAANAILVYCFLRRLLKPEQHVAALFAALVFCCHPLQVETVAWISTGRDLLSVFFALAAANLILTREDRLYFAAGTLLFCVGLLSKPSISILPAALLFLFYGWGQLTPARMKLLLLWFIPALIDSYVTKHIQQLDADLRLKPMDLADRLLVAVDTLSFYVQKTVVPFPLGADYGRTREVALADDIWTIGLAGLFACGLLILIFRKKVPNWVYYFGGLFALFLIPVLGIIPFQAQAQSTVSDRYAYLPLIGVGALIGMLAARHSWVRAVVTAILILWCGMTIDRAAVWSGNEIFFRDMLDKNPGSHIALSSLGVEFILSGRLPEAEEMLNRAKTLRPTDIIPRTNLAQLYLLQNRPDRVLSEIAPLLEDREFLRINQTETRALASAYRLAGRAEWSMGLWSKANDFYCRWFALDYENMEGRTEISRFVEDAKRHQINLKDCPRLPFNG